MVLDFGAASVCALAMALGGASVEVLDFGASSVGTCGTAGGAVFAAAALFGEGSPTTRGTTLSAGFFCGWISVEVAMDGGTEGADLGGVGGAEVS